MPRSDRRRRSSAAPRDYRSLRTMRMEQLEQRNLFAALPLGAAPMDTAEYMLGRVAVVPILLESNGQIDPNTENWTPESIESTLAKIRSGVQWWSDALDRLGTVHSLEFLIDDQFAINPFDTPYEAISRPSQFHTTIIGAFLEEQGYGDAGTIDNAIRLFNHDARVRMNTDWAFSILIVNSANDEDGQFAPGSEFNTAFAYPGGQYVVSPSTRPVSTITHEVGHIFWARDEYPGAGSWTDRRGYYNAQNWNAADNPTAGFVQEPSIMRAGTGLNQSFFSYELPESTMAMIGWRDSDGNGIFDVLDVPLKLEGIGRYDARSEIFSFTGSATAVPLMNQNSSGFQNDITLNRVDRIEYRVDGGPWQTAATINAQFGDVQFELELESFSTIEMRAIDDRVGVTSAIYASDAFLPLFAGANVGGIAYVENGAAEAEVSPQLLAGVTVSLAMPDGSPLFAGAVDPDQFTDRIRLPEIPGANFVAIGHVLDGRVGSVAAPASTGSRAFGFFNSQFATWQSRWAPDKALAITFDQPVGQVDLDAVGLGTAFRPSFGRLEAYDADGILLTRYSTEGLIAGQHEAMTVKDVSGRIASVRAFGHAFTEIGLDNLRYGVNAHLETSTDGVFHFSGIPDGNYRLTLEPENLTFAFPGSGDLISLQSGAGSTIAAGFVRVRSPWTNPDDPFDVDGNSAVDPLDALLVLNEIARNGAGTLRNPEQMRHFVDTNNDGTVTPLDALLVLNEIGRRNRAGTSEGEGPEAAAPPGGSDDSGRTFRSGASGGAAAAVDALFAVWPATEEEKKLTDFWGQSGEVQVDFGQPKSLV